MGDLISRSALLDSLISCKGLGRKSCEEVIKCINNQPVAYDLDSVVKKLERGKELSYYNQFEKDKVHLLEAGKNIAFCEAIEIMKAGGAE